ncbi:MAG: hypothetical protein WCO13_03310 [Bacteroidota bacterium]
MKKLILFVFIVGFFTTHQIQAQGVSITPKPDYWGTFCLVSQTVGDTNFFKLDLSQLTSEFEKIYFKFYYLEQDVFHTQLKEYNIEKNTAIIAVPKKYSVEDYRHFMADMKKMTQTAFYNYTADQKLEYIQNHKDK